MSHEHHHHHPHGLIEPASPDRRSFLSSLISAALFAQSASAQTGAPDPAEMAERYRKLSEDYEHAGLGPFKGITTNGEVVPGLFQVRPTGVSTEPVRIAAENFIATLGPAQLVRTMFPVDDVEWRKWMNQNFYVREGICFADMTAVQRNAAFALLRASLSAKGFELTRNIMRLNETLAELTNDHVFLGEWLYYMQLYGQPSATEPWGWKLEGHHAIINYFILGDQVVMTPLFVGSEPARANSGKYKGLAVLQEEQKGGLTLLHALSAPQRQRVILSFSKTGNLGASLDASDPAGLSQCVAWCCAGDLGDALRAEQDVRREFERRPTERLSCT